MKSFLPRILMAAAVTLVAFASSARPQQADADPAPATPRQQPSTATQQSPQNHDAQPPSSGDTQTQEALAFTGHVMEDHGQLVLKDPVTKMSYQLDDQPKARQYVGKQVKVLGKLEMKSNTIHVDNIELLP
jgi:hypothetical protein